MNRERAERWFSLMIIGLALLMVGGCAKKKVETATQVTEERIAPSQEAEEAFPQEARVREGEIEEARAVEGRRAVMELGDILFDFDRSDIRSDARKVLEENAGWLKENPDVRITIEGHADERGTSEYNLALGERRAKSIKQYLTALGVEPERFQTLSYGEERPFCLQHNEGCWQKNRRGHFVSAD